MIQILKDDIDYFLDPGGLVIGENHHQAHDFRGVDYNNPIATQVGMWKEWRIELTRFADQGVDLTNIDSITIGLGNRNNPVAGGEGEMWFDDIRLYRPTPR